MTVFVGTEITAKACTTSAAHGGWCLLDRGQRLDSAGASKEAALPLESLHRFVAFGGIEPHKPAYFDKRQDPLAHQICDRADIAPVVLGHFGFNPPWTGRLFMGRLFVCRVDHMFQTRAYLNDKRANTSNSYKTGNLCSSAPGQ
jgi:hypothetical protein